MRPQQNISHAFSTRGVRVAIATLTLALLTHGTATAGTMSLQYNVSEDLSLLQNPSSTTLAQAASAKSEPTLVMERDMPYMMFKNTSTTASISEIDVTIGDTSMNFDWSLFVSGSPGVTYNLITPDALTNHVRSDVVKISFTNFTPGKSVIIRTALDSDATGATPFVDYRQVLFHVNGSNTSQNSVITATFSNTGSQDQTLAATLPNFTDPQPLVFLGVFPSNCFTDHVTAFSVTPNLQPVTPEGNTPEPASVVLSGLGLLGFVAYCRRLKRRR